MPESRSTQVAEIVLSAIERDPQEWPSLLDQACGSDASLRVEVESLLEFQGPAQVFMQEPAVHLAARILIPDQELNPRETLGDYQVISKLGAGGMGDVYLAQDSKLGRKVALKLVRAAMSTDDIVARFRHEERILASLNDPNIAQLYGGGVSDDGRPFFAMEYVEGKRLDEFCNERSLTTRERLQIFRKVCSAVTYAHQHLVIHRDLKPANIRVTPDGEPKLLDFGIAKLLDSETQFGEQTITLAAVMTPDYASLEQVRGESMTTASDIYSLGVVLYELLTGAKPYNLTGRKSHEISRAITDQEPTRPSLVTHHSPLVTDRKVLRGDLDNILLMALRKEPARRYSSVGEFSEDIRRHLDGLPVRARKDTFGYRSAKFIRRNRLGVAAAMLVALSLVAGMLLAQFEARRAEKRFNDVRRLANSFLFEIDPQIENLLGATGARQTLVKRALEYLDSLAREAGADRSLQYELGSAYLQVGKIQGKPFQPNLGDAEGALGSFRKARGTFENILKSEPGNVIVQRDLGYTYQFLGTLMGEAGDKPADLAQQRKAVAVFEALKARDPENAEYRLNLVRGYNYLAAATLNCAIADQTVQLFPEALEIHRQAIATAEALAKESPTNRELLQQLASTYLRIGYTLRELDDLTGGELVNYPIALDYDSKAVAIFDDLSASEPTNILFRRHSADARLSLGHSQLGLGNATAALETFGQALVTFEALVAVDPLDKQARHDLADTYRAMAEALAATPDAKGALDYADRALALYHAMNVTHPSRVALIQTYEIKADLFAKAGDKKGATDNYGAVLSLLDQWITAEPTNKSAARNRALDLARIERLRPVKNAETPAS